MTISEQREAIQADLRENEAAKLLLLAKLKAIQHICQHKNAPPGKFYKDYGGGSDWCWKCPECGKSEGY